MSNIRSLLRWSAQLALTLAIQCGTSSAVVRGQCRVDLLGFPGDWAKISAAGDEVVLLPTIYKIWRLPGTGRDELLFGAAVRGDEGLTMGYGGAKLKPEWFEAMPKVLTKSYSKNFFAVSIDGKRPRVRKVSDAERLRAEPVLNGYNYLSATDQKIDVFDEKNSPSGVKYAGKLFARSGRAWADTVGVLSPTGRWLAVLSYTSPEKRTKFRGVLEEGGEPGHGVIHVDVYDPATGKKVLAGKHLFREAPSSIFVASVWVEDRYLIIPLDFNSRTCLLLTLPDESACSSTVAPAGDRPEGRTVRATGGWLMYTPSDKSFTVEVPATSHREVETYEGLDESTPAGWRPLHSYVAATLLETPRAFYIRGYFISVFEVMSREAASQKQINELIDELAAKSKRLTSSTQMNIDGRRVREVTLASKDTDENEFVRVRFIETDARVYMLTYITNTSDIYSHSATRFFNSFRAKR
jgi:hypothetical protein